MYAVFVSDSAQVPVVAANTLNSACVDAGAIGLVGYVIRAVTCQGFGPVVLSYNK